MPNITLRLHSYAATCACLLHHRKVHHHSFRAAMIMESLHVIEMATNLHTIEGLIPVIGAVSMILMHLSES